MTPKVSIITTTYNDADNLATIIERVKKQDYPNIEYIIVDGASQDETLSVIKEAEAFFGERLRWISEPDHGIYDAINKGLRMATGDIIGLMFDAFTSGEVITKMVETIAREGTDGVHGDINYVDGDKIVRRWRMGQGSIRLGWMPGHPTLYLKREVYDKYGYYKEDYRIAADYEFIVRILKDNEVKLSYIPEVLVNMFYGGTSTGGLSSYIASFRESFRALRENHVHFAFGINVLRTCRVLLQFVRK
jgi:glycosyltransferase